MAQAFPRSTFVGIDTHPDSVAAAREHGLEIADVFGPYASHDEAQTAQRQLGAAQIRDSKIVSTPPSAL